MSKILVVDDEMSMRELVRTTLSMKGYEVTTVPSASQALTIIFQEVFDLILLDINLGNESGISILKKIRETQKNLPIVIYSGTLTAELEKEAMAAGANEVLRKDIGIPQIAEQIGKIIKAKDSIFKDPSASGKQEKSILIVDDESSIRRVLSEFFKTKDYKIFEAENGEKALEVARSEKFPVVLLDIDMPVMNGIATLPKLLEINPKLGVVMVTGNQEDENVKKAMELGACGYILKPFDFLYLELVVMSKLAIAEAS
ncbi:MAG: response regulator [Candidatus Omnitrophica bacterium]|nr:response regulator [Candidatus Omnitrophota bacterium]